MEENDDEGNDAKIDEKQKRKTLVVREWAIEANLSPIHLGFACKERRRKTQKNREKRNRMKKNE